MSRDLVYIASPSFSGSTLLTFLLGAHDSIATVGELKWSDLDSRSYPCSCGAQLAECGFWKEVAGEMVARGFPIDLDRPATQLRCYGRPLSDRICRAELRGRVFEMLRHVLLKRLPACRQALSSFRAINQNMIDTILKIQGGQKFLDASKDPLRLKYLQETGDYRVYVVHLVRDGRAVTNSAIKNQGFNAARAAREWVELHQQIELVCSSTEVYAYVRLRYEDVCRDPSTALAPVFLTIEESMQDVVAAFGTSVQHILGNRMRLERMKKIELDEGWRERLNKEDRATFEHIGGALNCRYGYG